MALFKIETQKFLDLLFFIETWFDVKWTIGIIDISITFALHLLKNSIPIKEILEQNGDFKNFQFLSTY